MTGARITEIVVHKDQFTDLLVRFSPDDQGSKQVCFRTTMNGSTFNIDMDLKVARELVEALHEAIGTVSAWSGK